MVKVLIKQLYDLLVGVVSSRTSQAVGTESVAYLLSFPNNDAGLIGQLKEQYGDKLVVYYSSNCQEEAEKYQEEGISIWSLTPSLSFFFKTVPLLSRARIIICDNYFPVLSSLTLAAKAQVIQIWHANGAIKTFGWQDNQTAKRSKSEQVRFQKVYDRFDKIVVGSAAMGEVFKNSYHLTDDKLLPLGLPRTDHFFAEAVRAEQRHQFQTTFPDFATKKIALYAPTYREQGQSALPDLVQLKQGLGSEWVLLYQFHPHTKAPLFPATPGLSDLRTLSLSAVLPSVDCLITDYSSIPFEYALVRPTGKILFYCYDLVAYRETVGLQANFEDWAAPGMVTTVEALSNKINGQQGLTANEVNPLWNTYNDGQATDRLLHYLSQL